MKHPPLGNSPRKTDTVARAMEFLKDRPMPEPKADTRQNFGPKEKRTYKSSSSG